MKLPSLLNPSNWFFPESRRYHLEVPASDNEILKIKDFAQAVCIAAGYSNADSNIVKLVLEEVCVNIIRHGYLGLPQGKIQLEMSIGLLGLKMKVTDQGRAFDFKGIKDPDLNHYVDIGKRGGLGIWFIRKMMTKVSYQSHFDHNEWILYYRSFGSSFSNGAAEKFVNSPSCKFILAFFILFSFLIFLVYVLSCLAQAPIIGLDHSILHRMAEGFNTILCRGVLLVYGAGLIGFYLIFRKLFSPFQDDQSKRIRAAQSKISQVNQDQGEYERLVGVISELEDQLRQSEKKLVDQAKLQVELRLTESTRQDELRAFENARQEEAREIENIRKEAGLEIERAKRDLTELVKKNENEAGRGDRQSGEEIKRLSEIKSDLEKQLTEAQKKITYQENIQVGMQKEVRVAQQIQHALLPKEFPQIEGFQIGASYRAAKEVGGDYYDFIWVDPTTLGIAVGDVAGKGVPGSMVMAMIRTAMRLEARKNKSPSNVLLKVHQHVNGDMKRGMFATMFYIILDSRNRSISFASAGHNPMILYRKSTDEVYFLKPKGFPLGIDLPDESLFAKTLEVQKLILQKDDVLMIYTDGVTEAMNQAEEQFGEARLIQAIRENAHRTPEELVEKLEIDIADFVGAAEQNDDVTIVVIKENMQAEDVIYKFRKNLLSLVEKEGLSIAEACRRMNVSPQTYYHYKEIFDKKGNAGLKPIFPKKRAVIKELSMTQKNAVISVVKSYPVLGPAQIVEFLKKNSKIPLRLDRKVVSAFLFRKGLSEAKERKIFAANEIDTV